LHDAPDTIPGVTLMDSAPVAPLPDGFDARFLCTIQGTVFVRHAGLVHYAHLHNVTSIKVTITHADATCVMAHATVTRADGRVFEDVADSTEDNVSSKVRPHWRRLASTRATGRALRAAYDVPFVCLEELD
jgi:hypothetical protein